MKNLEDLLSTFPLIQIATEDDNSLILDFYNTITMSEGSDNITYERSPNYFSFLKQRSDKFIAFIIKDCDQVQGICALNFRESLHGGKKIVIGYVGDLRIRTSKKYTLYWRRFANLLFKYSYNFADTFNCDIYYTALIDSNRFSTLNFINKGLGEIKFKKITSYHMVNYLSPFKIFAGEKKPYIITRAKHEDLTYLKEFMSINTRGQLFNYCGDEINRRLNTWNNFSINNIILIRDLNHNLVAISSIWNPDATKRIRFINNSKLLDLCYKLVSSVSKLNLPKTNHILDILYLNQFIFKENFSPPKNFLKIIMREIYNHEIINENFNFISYCDFDKNNLNASLSPDFFTKIKMGIYEMRHESRPALNTETSDITFEMSLV